MKLLPLREQERSFFPWVRRPALKKLALASASFDGDSRVLISLARASRQRREGPRLFLSESIDADTAVASSQLAPAAKMELRSLTPCSPTIPQVYRLRRRRTAFMVECSNGHGHRAGIRAIYAARQTVLHFRISHRPNIANINCNISAG